MKNILPMFLRNDIKLTMIIGPNIRPHANYCRIISYNANVYIKIIYYLHDNMLFRVSYYDGLLNYCSRVKECE